LRFKHLFIALPSSVLLCLFAALFPIFAWPLRSDEIAEEGYPRHIKWQDLLIGFAVFLTSEGIRQPIFDFTSTFFPFRSSVFLPGITTHIPLLVHVSIGESIRYAGIVLSTNLESTVHDELKYIRPPKAAFFHAFWLGLGSSLVEAVMRSSKLYLDTGLYGDVLPDEKEGGKVDTGKYRQDVEEGVEEEEEPVALSEGEDIAGFLASSQVMQDAAEEEMVVESERARFEQWLQTSRRIELEESLGQPLFQISTAILVLWSLNRCVIHIQSMTDLSSRTNLYSCRLLLTLTLTFFLYAASTRDQALFQPRLASTFCLVTLYHFLQSLAWSILTPRMGLESVSYGAAIFNFLALFLILGIWGAIR